MQLRELIAEYADFARRCDQLLPAPIAANLVEAGKLVQVLKPFAPMTPGMFLYYPSRHQMMPKLRAFIDHVKAHPVAAGKMRGRADEKRARETKRSKET